MEVKAFFDQPTYTLTYVAYDPESRDAVVIDPVFDFDVQTWRTSTASVDEVQAFVREKSLNVRWVLDTHAHADHLSGTDVMKAAFGAPTAIGNEITAVQQLFAGVYGLEEQIATDGSQWDELLVDGQKLAAGSFQVEALHTPGHTPACYSFRIGDTVFTGDALFMPDYGTGRCDFPKGSASDLYDSITQKLYTMPDATRVFVGHDYLPGASKEQNIRLRASTSRAAFVEAREARDAQLAPPKLILQSLQVNIDGGRLPAPEANGRRYFKMPINFLGS